MNKQIKGILQYSLLILLTLLLLWLALANIEVNEGETKLGFILKVWTGSDKSFLMLSGMLALTSHAIRAERWKLLLEPLGYHPSLKKSFLSVMLGYFVNLGIPRGGEISRCYNLYQLDGTPLDLSFGTVVAERIVDLIILLTLISFSMIIEFDNLVLLFDQLELSLHIDSLALGKKIMVGALLLGAFVGLYFIINYMFHEKIDALRKKLRQAFVGIKKGLFSIFSIKKRVLFLLYSLLIWVLYFFMSYFIVLAFPETQSLGLLNTLTIFVIGGIAMAIPLPGGAGSYHLLVPLGLVTLFGINKEEATAFSFIFHGWQTFIVIVVGVVSLLISQYEIRKIKRGVIR